MKELSQINLNILLVENGLKKLQKFDSSYFRGKNYCGDNGTKNYLVFQPMYKYVKTIISEWKSKGLSNESIKTPSTCNKFLNPLLDYVK